MRSAGPPGIVSPRVNGIIGVGLVTELTNLCWALHLSHRPYARWVLGLRARGLHPPQRPGGLSTEVGLPARLLWNRTLGTMHGISSGI